VVRHGSSRLTSTPEGAAGYIEADLHQPEEILAAAEGRLDFGQPVGLLLMGVMGHLDDAGAYRVVAGLIAGLPPGSYFALQDGALTSDEFGEAQQGYDDTGAIPYRLRRPAQIAAFFDGLDLLPPGVVQVPQWRPDPGPSGLPPDIGSFGGVARKP
jgi:hypothetical protein